MAESKVASTFESQQEREAARTWAIGMLSNHVVKRTFGTISFSLKDGKVVEMVENITKRP